MADDVIFSKENHIGFITLNRTQALNALTLPMILNMQEQLSAWENDASIHAVFLQAEPGKAFCAGGDIRWLYEQGKSANAQQLEFFFHEYRLNYFIHQFSKPFIAFMDGITMGGGVGIGLHANCAIGTENFIFAMPETTIGFFPDIGASYLLARCPGYIGTYLGLTGNRLKVADAHALGLIKFAVPSHVKQQLLEQLFQLDLTTDAFNKVNQCIQCLHSSTHDSDIEKNASLIEELFSKETMESIISALEAHPANWSDEIIANLRSKSPISLKVTLEQIKRARGLNIKECLEMDYCLVQHFIASHDFYEGVRALLIDKDKTPKWQPECIEKVSQAQVDTFFTSPSSGPLGHLLPLSGRREINSLWGRGLG